jgi:hypothetical protein
MSEIKTGWSFAACIAGSLARRARTSIATDIDMMDRCVIVIDAARGWNLVTPRVNVRFLVIGEGPMPDFVDPSQALDARRFSDGFAGSGGTDAWQDDQLRLTHAVDDLAIWLRGGPQWMIMADEKTIR